MTYSVWADGVRIGETKLELRPSPRRRTGAFHPTDTGGALLAGVAGRGARHRLEVRDPAGIPIRYDSIAITDVERLVAAACARRPTPAYTAPEGIRGPIRLRHLADARPPRQRFFVCPQLLRAEHLASEGSEPPPDRAVHDRIAKSHDHAAQNRRIHVEVRHDFLAERASRAGWK